MRVFVTFEGEYSDKRVVAVYSTLERAKQCRIGDKDDIEEFELDGPIQLQQAIANGYRVFNVAMDVGGNVVSIADKTEGRFDYPDDNTYLRYEGELCTLCIAKDEQGAIKIAAERHAKVIESKRAEMIAAKKRCEEWRKEVDARKAAVGTTLSFSSGVQNLQILASGMLTINLSSEKENKS